MPTHASLLYMHRKFRIETAEQHIAALEIDARTGSIAGIVCERYPTQYTTVKAKYQQRDPSELRLFLNAKTLFNDLGAAMAECVRSCCYHEFALCARLTIE